MDSLFGEGTSLPVRFFIAFVVVFALIGVTAWLIRRFGTGALGGTGTRGRAPRLAVIEAGAVDGRRKLVLIRRDNIEHLIMIGGPTDIVVEANIVRGQNARDAATSRISSTGETLPRTSPAEETAWPLQPEAAPRPARASRTDDARFGRCRRNPQHRPLLRWWRLRSARARRTRSPAWPLNCRSVRPNRRRQLRRPGPPRRSSKARAQNRPRRPLRRRPRAIRIWPIWHRGSKLRCAVRRPLRRRPRARLPQLDLPQTRSASHLS